MRGRHFFLPVLALLLPSGMGRAGDRPSPTASTAPAARQSASWEVLRKALVSRDYSIRLLATQALGDIQRIDVTSWLEHALGDPEHDVRVSAVDSLRRIGSRRALDVLRTVRDDQAEALDIRALAASALLSHSDE